MNPPENETPENGNASREAISGLAFQCTVSRLESTSGDAA